MSEHKSGAVGAGGKVISLPVANVEAASTGPDDAFLIQSMLGGDAAALDKLMDRYDRLVRFTIFRVSKVQCGRDPHWVDSIASETWTGFVQSLRRASGNVPGSVSKYLMQTARNRCISALRKLRPDRDSLEDGGEEGPPLQSESDEDPAERLSRLEELEALRDCVSRLDQAGRELYAQIDAITDRRWKDAAGALGLAESTLRSRWKRVSEALRNCLQAKRGAKNIARGTPEGDS
ncbi:MAG: sigma-70 family RNA polymerase sigma factor [Phycisphaerales bacterium]|nr:MAG: sigma-70 family RNA polymerase sigma factor [Phycisphaerales bacterium]